MNRALQKPERFDRFECLGQATQPHFVDRVFEILKIIHQFDDFERKDIMVMLEQMTCYRVAAESPIIFEDEAGDFMMLLLHGSVEVVKKDGAGIYRQLRLAEPGEALGEMSLIDDQPRSAGCIARSEVTFAVLSRAGLNDILRNEPSTGCKILMFLLLMSTERLRSVSKRLAVLLGENLVWL